MLSAIAASSLSLSVGGVGKKVFIDGEAGTTGLQVLGRLQSRTDIELLTLPADKRKDAAARQEAINEADAVILCLPDAAAIEAVALCAPDNDRTVFIDASTAHRTNPDWVYGFAEMRPGQREAIASSTRIANPGCYPTGFIAATNPLVSAGLLKKEARLVASAVSGYSGGGKPLMEVYEGGEPHEPWGAYGFNLDHKHLPEMCQYSGLEEPPIFLPAVGSFAQGMVVSVPIHFDHLTDAATGSSEGVGNAIHAALSKHYEGARFVKVMPFAGSKSGIEASLLERGAFLRPDALNDTNSLELFVYCNEERRTCVVAARLDNLGKGASGAAVQNLNLALGLEEGSGLN